MIPLKLHIKNFLSYGSPTQVVDFMPHHLICLSGKNGHGKSALLDALTWAVWGQARKGLGTSKADEGLLRLGQTNMVVALDFTCNGQNYRVRREFIYERGKGVTQLDFGIIAMNPDMISSTSPGTSSGTLHELTDKTIRATQMKIEQTIGFDYESFINSVFLRQGNSNEFSKKSPKERKEVLATILGLGKYEALRKCALDRAREGALVATHLTKNCELLTAEIAPGAACREELAQLLSHAAQLNTEEQQLHAQAHYYADQKKQLQEEQRAHQQIIFTHEQISKDSAAHEQALSELFATWRTIARNIRAANQKPLSETQKKEIEQELATIQKKINNRLAITQEMMACSTQLQTIKTKLQEQYHEQQQQQLKQCHLLETKLNILQAEQSALQTALAELIEQQTPLTAELTRIAPDAALLPQRMKELAQQELLFERRKAIYHAWVNRGNKLALELKKMSLQIQQLNNSVDATCPLCDQDLSTARVTLLHKELRAQEDRIKHQVQRLTRIIPQLKELLTQQHKQLTSLKEIIAQLTHNVTRADTITTQLAQIARTRIGKETILKQQKQELEHYRAELATAHKQTNILNIPLDALLLGNEEYRATHYKLKTCEQALGGCSYDEQRYETVQRIVQTLTHEQVAQQELMQQATLQEKRKQEIRAHCTELRRLRAEKAATTQILAQHAELQQKLAEIAVHEEEIERAKLAITQQKESLAHQRGSLEQNCLRIAQQEQALKREHEQLASMTSDTQEYQLLAQALSKDGIQGLLIENVIPEIETEANDLLARLTNNQAQLSIESVRDLKSGGTKETLEIKIADAVGVRPYELFSGGEAFRIDFALRLAVSKLLARRTGTSLQTLIIDEGFGSQDEEGLNHIMEALYSIQEDFAKIIIVSHLPAMKDQFPVHFNILKTPRGSTVQVIEQG